MSKDWCASGLRVGCLWTLNARLQAALQNVNAFYGVSGIAQHMIAEMLEDLPFVDKYLKENKRRLGSAYDTLAGWALQLAKPHNIVALAIDNKSQIGNSCCFGDGKGCN